MICLDFVETTAVAILSKTAATKRLSARAHLSKPGAEKVKTAPTSPPVTTISSLDSRGNACCTSLTPYETMSNPETPSWPSLYDVSVELFPIVHREPIQPSGRYLSDANGAFPLVPYALCDKKLASCPCSRVPLHVVLDTGPLCASLHGLRDLRFPQPILPSP